MICNFINISNISNIPIDIYIYIYIYILAACCKEVYIYYIYILGWNGIQMPRFGMYLGLGVTVRYDFGTTGGKKILLCSVSFHLF